MIKPHEYQQNNINEILDKFKIHNKICYQLDTGGGKTVVFSFLSKYWRENIKSKVLILCHREELVNQSAETLVQLGITYEKVLPSIKRYHHNADVYIAMIETLDRRLKKNPRFLLDVGLVIADEAHVQIFSKVYDFFPKAKFLGVTATPIVGGRKTYWKCDRCQSTSLVLDTCCNMEMMEWSKPRTMSEVYEDIVVGPKIDFLIEFGQLVKEINFVQNYADLSQLQVDSKGEFSNESQDQVFGSEESSFNVVLNYEKLCLGKKTIVFNNSTKTNLKVYEQFVDKGYNAKMYDSVNDKEGSRSDIVKWFKETPDAILLNCGIFTAGLNVREIESEILNVATTSLSRYLQMAGRAGRSTNEIYKPNFILIDGGGNVNRFGRWSDPTRDWVKIFFEGIGKDRAKKETAENVRKCEECGGLTPRHDSTCEVCGFKPAEKIKPERLVSEDVLQPIDKLPLPNGQKIADYVEHRKENIHFGFKILSSQILDLFAFNSVTKGNYLCNLEDGRLDKRLGELIRPVYFVLIKRFPDSGNRTLKQVTKKIKEKLGKYYNI